MLQMRTLDIVVSASIIHNVSPYRRVILLFIMEY